MPVTIPCVSGKLMLQLWDHDTMDADDIIGTTSFNFADIESGRYEEYFWANMYGAPLGVHGKHTDRMNNEPRYASYWRGRILL
jgi:hypothetical protein